MLCAKNSKRIVKNADIERLTTVENCCVSTGKRERELQIYYKNKRVVLTLTVTESVVVYA